LFNDCLAAIFIYRDKVRRRVDIEPNLVMRTLSEISQGLYDVLDEEFVVLVNKILAKIRGRYLKKMNRNPGVNRLAALPDVEVWFGKATTKTKQ
jgi:hypothetical protein